MAMTNNNISDKSKPKKSIHAGHRNRLRERYRRAGMDDYAPHEVLELLLTYAIPRGDVNPQAHALIERFGSVAGAMDASVEELCEVEGIGPESALFLKILPDVFRQYSLSQCNTNKPMDTVAKIGDFLHGKYVGVNVERVYLLLLDNSLRVIECILLGEGSVNSSTVTVRTIAEYALRKQAAAVVLSHNHPKGLTIPSGSDIEVTQTVESALETLGIPLLEHIIVTENSYAPIMRHHKGMLRSSPLTGKLDKGFYQRFYGEI
jgi:DNA repair protein RadC